jgi:hypothetical protein
MALDAITKLTAPMPAPPVRQFSFTDFQTNNPTAPPPGDRLDAEFDRANTSISDTITWANVSLNTDGTIRDGVIGENNLVSGLFEDVSQGVIDDVQPLVDQATAASQAAQVSASNAATSAGIAQAQAAIAFSAASTANTASYSALGSLNGAQGAATSAANWALNAENSANNAVGAEAAASDYAVLTQAWAEHMPDTIPPNILATMDVTGDHWSARWWANKAASAFGALAWLYLGALPAAPGSTPTGDPIPIGAIYYNTTTQQPYVWDGTQWQSFTLPAKAVVLSLIYQAVAGQTVFDTSTTDLGGHTHVVTTEPLEVFVNGVRVPQTFGSYTGDWNNAGSVITFNTPLAAGTLVMIDVLSEAPSGGGGGGGGTDDDPYLPLAGGTMTGPLLLAGDATGAMMAVTKEQLDAKLDLAGGVMTGPIALSGPPTQPNYAATKAYADLMLPLAGGTMTGVLTLAGQPLNGNEASTKAYVDMLAALKLNLSGGTLTGDLVLNAAPTVTLGAATKGYVDTSVAAYLKLSGGTMTGDLVLRGGPSSANMAVNKAYVDAAVGAYLPLSGGTLNGSLAVNPSLYVYNALYINPANGWEWVQYRDGSGNHINQHRSGWYDHWNGSNGVRSWIGASAVVMTLDGGGTLGIANNASIPGGLGVTYAGGHSFRFTWDGQFPHAIVDNAADIQLASTSWVNGNFATTSYVNGQGYATQSWVTGSFILGDNLTWMGLNGNGNIYADYGRPFQGQVQWAIIWSDQRLKANIRPTETDALGLLNRLAVYSCDYTAPIEGARVEHWDCALIAREVGELIPNAYTKALNDKSYDTVRDLPLIATLIRAVQQLTERVTALEARA